MLLKLGNMPEQKLPKLAVTKSTATKSSTTTRKKVVADDSASVATRMEELFSCYKWKTVTSEEEIVEYLSTRQDVGLDTETTGLDVFKDKLVGFSLGTEDDCIYIKSDNPYVKYDHITGIQEQQKKPKHWNIGFQAGFGFQYGMLNKTIDVGPYLGVGISWGFGF